MGKGFKSRLLVSPKKSFLFIIHNLERPATAGLLFYDAKSGITEIVTLALDAIRLLAMPSLRSLQVPTSSTTQAHAKGAYKYLRKRVFFFVFRLFAYFFSLLPYCLFSRQQLLSAPKLGSHCTKRIFLPCD